MVPLISLATRLRSAFPKYSALGGYGFALLGALLFSTKTIVIKLAYARGADAETMQALRMLIALPIYLVIGLRGILVPRPEGARAPRVAGLLSAAAIGLLGYYVSSYLDLKGLESISAQLERLILFTYPFFVVIFGAVFLGQRLRGQSLLAIALSYAGLGIVFAPGGAGRVESPFGAALVLVAAMTFAGAQLLAKRAVETMGARSFTCVAMIAASAAALIQFLIADGLRSNLPLSSVLALGCWLAIAGTVLPSFFMNAALGYITAEANAAIGAISPIATLALAVLFLGESLTVASALGGILVIIGVVWFVLAEQS